MTWSSRRRAGCSFAQLPAIGKPLFVGEAGITGQTTQERVTRAGQLTAKMNAAFAAGAGGYLVWRVTKSATDKYDITFDGDDPLLGSIATMARSIQ